MYAFVSRDEQQSQYRRDTSAWVPTFHPLQSDGIVTALKRPLSNENHGGGETISQSAPRGRTNAVVKLCAGIQDGVRATTMDAATGELDGAVEAVRN